MYEGLLKCALFQSSITGDRLEHNSGMRAAAWPFGSVARAKAKRSEREHRSLATVQSPYFMVYLLMAASCYALYRPLGYERRDPYRYQLLRIAHSRSASSLGCYLLNSEAGCSILLSMHRCS